MASGTATILANATSLPEVGADAALYFESGDGADLAQKMITLASDHELREHLAKAGMAQAACFSWERCAAETAAVYQATVTST